MIFNNFFSTLNSVESLVSFVLSCLAGLSVAGFLIFSKRLVAQYHFLIQNQFTMNSYWFASIEGYPEKDIFDVIRIRQHKQNISIFYQAQTRDTKKPRQLYGGGTGIYRDGYIICSYAREIGVAGPIGTYLFKEVNYNGEIILVGYYVERSKNERLSSFVSGRGAYIRIDLPLSLRIKEMITPTFLGNDSLHNYLQKKEIKALAKKSIELRKAIGPLLTIEEAKKILSSTSGMQVN